MDSGGATPTSISLLHHYVGADSHAMDVAIEEIERRLDARIDAVGKAEVGLTAKTSLLAGDPPDVWDDWPGENVRPYVDSDVVADITTLWDEAGFIDAFFEHASRAARIDGAYYALPTNVQRLNNCFYDPAAFDAAGVDPDRIDGPDAFVTALDTIGSEIDAAPLLLPQKHPWPAFDLWDMALLATSDVERYQRILQDGRVEGHRTVVRDALEVVEDLLQFVPQEATYLDWQSGLKSLVEGTAATFVMGDWAAGVLDSQDGVAYGRDWDSMPFPGTANVFQVVMDALFVPRTTPNPDLARGFLREFGSAEVLEGFTRRRGAIPPRADCVMGDHSSFFREQMQAYRHATDYVSAARGPGIPPENRVELLGIIAAFLAEDGPGVERATGDIVGVLSS